MFTLSWNTKCTSIISHEIIYVPVGSWSHNSAFLSHFQRSFALCQGNRHFMSRHWGIKLIRQMHGRLSSIMKTEQEYNEYRYSNHSLRCRNEMNLSLHRDKYAQTSNITYMGHTLIIYFRSVFMLHCESEMWFLVLFKST